jgi:hypothetical protein
MHALKAASTLPRRVRKLCRTGTGPEAGAIGRQRPGRGGEGTTAVRAGHQLSWCSSRRRSGSRCGPAATRSRMTLSSHWLAVSPSSRAAGHTHGAVATRCQGCPPIPMHPKLTILNKSSGNPYVRDGDVLIGSGAPQAGGTLPQSAISSHLRPRRNPMMTPSPTALRRAAIGWSDAKLLTSSTACP